MNSPRGWKYAWAGIALLGVLATPALADTKPLSANNGSGVTINVLSLKHSEGETVTLRIEIVNEGNEDWGPTLSNMHLLDIVGRRSYNEGLSSNGCVAKAGKKVECWAMFGAPPPSVKALTVQFYEHFDLIPGVPISE